MSPFYQDRIKEIAPQERSLLETMSLMRTELKTPANISKKIRKPPQQVSSLLKRMLKSGYLTVANHPGDKRSKVYRIKEGFFALWLAVSQSRVKMSAWEDVLKFTK
jgi:DNA-binding MarR family transcriptional regulator